MHRYVLIRLMLRYTSLRLWIIQEEDDLIFLLCLDMTGSYAWP